MPRPTQSLLYSILLALVMSLCGSAAVAADDADSETAPATDKKAGAPCSKADDKNVLAGPQTGDDAVKRSGRGFSGKGNRKGAAVMAVLSQLNLSKKQMRQVQQLMSEGKAAGKEFHKKFGTEMKQLRQQIQSSRDSDDRKKVRELAGRRRKLMEKSGGRHAMKKKLAEILSPQQMQQFEKNMRELHRKMRSEKNKKSDRGKGPIAPQSNAEAKDGTKLDI